MRWVRATLLATAVAIAIVAGQGYEVASASGEYILINIADTSDVAPDAGGASYATFGNTAILNNTSQVLFTATLGGGGQGVFVDSPSGDERAVVMDGDAAPGTGGGAFVCCGAAHDMNDDGDVAFLSVISGSSYTRGIFVDTGISQAPVLLTPNATFDTINGPCEGMAFTNGGSVLYFGEKFVGGLNYFRGLYLDSQLVAGGLNENYYGSGPESLNNSDQTAYWHGSLFVDSTAVIQQGDPAPGTGGGTFSGFGQACVPQGFAPAINDAGDLAFYGEVQNGSTNKGLFEYSGGGTTARVLVGDGAPAGGTFANLSRPYLNNGGTIAFWSLTSMFPSYGIFTEDSGTVTAVALQGEAAPDTGGGTLDLLASRPDINDAGEVLFSGDVNGGSVDEAIFLALPPGGDHDGDGTANDTDNCLLVSNPAQTDTDADMLGDQCDPDDDGDSICDPGEADVSCTGSDNCRTTANPLQENYDGDALGDACDDDDDDDLVDDSDEVGCGTNSLDENERPERVDGPFSGVSDDGDVDVDEALPGGAGAFDCDGDGYTGTQEDHVYSYIGQLDGDQKTCQEYDLSHPNPNADIKPSLRWPSDFNKYSGVLDSFNRIDVLDLTSFMAPVRYMDTDVGTHPGDVRWDLRPGPEIFGKDINVADLVAIMAPGASTGAPPMLGGVRAMGGPVCPWAP